MIDGILTLDDIKVKGKVVLLRLDINCPLDAQKHIQDATRIQQSLPTLRELMEKGAKIVAIAHQGDPTEYPNFISLKEHARLLKRLLGKNIKFIEDIIGPQALKAIKGIKNGQVLLLENIRILAEETTLFEKEVNLPVEKQADTFLVRKLAPLADIYINDAFGCVHRLQPSVLGFPRRLLSACGRLFEKEITALSRLDKNIRHPCIYLLGGNKISDAFAVVNSVLTRKKADKVLTMGLMGNIMLLAAGYRLGVKSENFIRDMGLAKFIPEAKVILSRFRNKIEVPVDVAYIRAGRREAGIKKLPVKEAILDIGSGTIKKYIKEICRSATIFMNGPAGCFEKEAASVGTRMIWRAVSVSNATTVIGGGHTIAAAKKFGLMDKFSFVSTGGGGLIRYLENKNLPAIIVLRESARRFVA